MSTDQITWKDGTVPVSVKFDDPYYSIQDGLAETQHVFIRGNDLHKRLCNGLHIAELGVGTGLNLLSLWQLAEQLDCYVTYTGFEAFPMTQQDLVRALTEFPSLGDLTEKWATAWQTNSFELRADHLTASIVVGDAGKTLRTWHHKADAWFLDGFSPAKNPELWTSQLMQDVANHTAPNGTFATYSAAGAVRRALTDAGFTVERVPGYGRKRHMTKGILA